jgi:serine protease AprX
VPPATWDAGPRRRHDRSVHLARPTALDHRAKPDIVAPGIGIESLSTPGSTLCDRGGICFQERPRQFSYLSLSGTSMSAPVVSGTVALMLQANLTLTPNAVKAILQHNR